jgi:hypothetical protein
MGVIEHTQDASQNMSESTLILIERTQRTVQPPKQAHKQYRHSNKIAIVNNET